MIISFFKKHWPVIFVGIILTIIIGLNFHPGKLVMGNDNFSPELDPKLTVIRSLLNPAWRDNRVLGIPSDSEQADVWRSLFFWLSSSVLPSWLISQGYLFLTLIIGVFSMGKVAQLLNNKTSTSLLFGSLLYLFSPITVWVYFYPVHLFVAAYAFTPLVLWRLLKVIVEPTQKNKLYLLLSSLIMGTTALTATMFITATITILSVSFFAVFHSKTMMKKWLIAIFIYLLPQLFWVLPFTTYVNSNNQALQDSFINREITSTTVQSEQSNNTIWNTLRFSTAWMDTKEDDQNYTYPHRNWFKDNNLGVNLGYLPAILALIGIIFSLIKFKKNYDLYFISLIGFFGWIFLNGNNPPFNEIYEFFDKNIPLFHQVFRWGSSKFWPILLIPMLILAVKGIESLIQTKHIILKSALAITFSGLIIYATIPVLSNSFIRNEVFLSVPAAYSSLKQNVPDKISLIDTSPHTNTRYFRRHDWGFWGSVFLNYLLPNPTTEKALIIGSHENEQSFNALDEAYYSGNPTAYANTLSRYSISTILSDKSVTNQGLGSSYSFPYNWDLHNQMVISNLFLSKIWSQDFLSLYQNNMQTSNHVFTISPNHDYEILNKSLAILNQNDRYVVSPNSGTIYPISQKSTQANLVEGNLNISSQPSATGNFNIQLTKETLSNLPVVARFKDSQLQLSPYFPSLSLNSSPIYQLPIADTKIPSNILTIGDQIISDLPQLVDQSNLSNSAYWINPKITDLTPNIKTVSCNPSIDTESSKICLSTDHNFTQSNATSITTTFNSSTPVIVDICLHSYLDNTCINSPKSFIADSVPKTITISPKNIIKKGDNLVIFYVAKTTDGSIPNLTISSLTLSQSSTKKSIAIETPVIEDISSNINVNSSDTLTLHLPVVDIIPELSIFSSLCSTRGNTNDILKIKDSIIFTTSNCFDGLYSSFSIPKSLGATSLLTYAKAKNISGIPLEYNLKQSGVDRRVTTDLLSTKPDKNFLKFTLIPTTNQNFTVELVNKGIGQTPSINSLSNFAAIPVPMSWLSLALTPTTETSNKITIMQPFDSLYSTGTYLAEITDSSSLYTLPTATSPYWRAVILQDKPRNLVDLYFQVLSHPRVHNKTLASGWQDAWDASNQDHGKYIVVIFFPNVLAYLGLIFGLGTALILVFVRPATKIVSTHKA